MLDIPKRISLPAQAAAAIRKGIEDRAWKEELPGERRLCELFHISRPTVRGALQLLAKEGLIRIRHGRRNRIVGRPRHPRGAQKGVVAIVTHEPEALSKGLALQSISEMRIHLAEHGFVTEIFAWPTRGLAAQRRKIEAFARQNHVICCLLLWVSRELQQWFATHRLPVLVLGSCDPSVQLPSFDVDYRSVCRHAAGMLLGRGHRRLGLIVPGEGRPGILASEQGFLEAVARHSARDVAQAHVLRHNDSAPSLVAKLDGLFNSPSPPTALVVARPQHVFNVFVYLLRRGLHVPGDVSLIARDHDAYFRDFQPPIAHYHFRRQAFHRRLIRLMLQMASQGHLAPSPHLISPQFAPGGTIAQPPGRA